MAASFTHDGWSQVCPRLHHSVFLQAEAQCQMPFTIMPTLQILFTGETNFFILTSLADLGELDITSEGFTFQERNGRGRVSFFMSCLLCAFMLPTWPLWAFEFLISALRSNSEVPTLRAEILEGL